MFASWGSIVYRARFTVIAVMVAGLLGLAAYGLSLQDHLSQSGWDDPGSESVEAAKLADGTFGRSTTGDVLALYTAPEGKTVDDPEFQAKVIDNLQRLVADNPDQIMKINGSYFKVDNGLSVAALADKTKQHAVTSIAIAGDNDTAVSNNFRDVESQFYIDGVDVQLAGLQPVANSLNDTMANDIKRMEMLAIPAVGVLLFFVFGGVVAAALPLIVGGLTVIGANGIIRLITNFTEVNAFVAPVVSLVGLGLAIDYGLFIVSRFREEIAEGYDTPTAVRRTVMTAGRTVMFSATMVAVSLGGLLLFPQGFLKSVAYGAIAAVMLAAISSITILPAILGILGKRIDALTFKKLRQTKTNEEIENGFWGKLTRWVMQHPLKVAVPIVAALLLMIIPLTGIKFGGINETYLPPDSPTRVAQAQFDELFPGNRTEPVRLVIEGADNTTLGQISKTANAAPGLVEKFTPEVATKDGVNVLKAGLTERNEARPTIDYLRSADWPEGTTVLVGGTPAIEQDSVDALLDRPAADGRIRHPADDLADVLDVRLARPAHQGRIDERARTGFDARNLDLDLHRRARFRSLELHAGTDHVSRPGVDHRDRLRPVDRLRSVPALPHGRSASAGREYYRIHPYRHGTYRPDHHRCRTDSDRGHRRIRPVRSGDDEIHLLRHDLRADHRRDSHPNVPGPRDHETARRRLLVGSGLDEADPAEDRGWASRS